MTVLGPVSTLLETELRAKTRRNGIVIWLDPDAHYSGFVDQRRADGCTKHLIATSA